MTAIPHKTVSTERAEEIALEALTFLAGDGARLARFLELTGLTPATLKAGITDPALHRAVLAHLMGEESLLFVFAAQSGLEPAEIAAANARLNPA